MAKQVITRITDDLDGSPDAGTVEFALDGIRYTIDLSDQHAKELRAVLDPYIDAGRLNTGRPARRGHTRADSGATFAERRDFNQAVRAWAASNNWPIAERGRIPQNVVDAYRAAA
jgi:hypothetical protein